MANARGRGTSCGKARKARRPKWKEEASRKIKKGGEQDKKGAKSKGEEGKGDDKGKEKEGAGRNPTTERRKAWFRKEEGGLRNPHAGGKTGVG